MAPEILGKYRLHRQLAAGGMGEVFLADQEGPHGFRRRVVVKRLLRHIASDPSFVDMFLAEARLAALITHPNVAQIIELGEVEGTFFIAMEYVRGRSLRDLLKTVETRGETIPAAAAVTMAIGVLRGLHAAHTLVDVDGQPRGCVHRDVSAENVLLAIDGTVKLVDFGIAKALSAPTMSTSLRGKYGYLAPEQYRHERLDARTDIFAAGVLLFELLTGSRPFAGDNAPAIMDAVLHRPTPALPPGVEGSARLDAAIGRALAKTPADRFESAEHMANELEGALASGELGVVDRTATVRDVARAYLEEEVAAQEVGDSVLGTEVLPTDADGRTVADPPRARRWPRLATGGAVLLVLGVTLAVLATRRSTSTRPTDLPAPTDHAVASDSASAEPAVPSAAAKGEPSAAASTVAARPNDPKPSRRTTTPPALVDRANGAGSLAFRVRPWAEIFVDGRSVGISPIAPLELSAGRHHVLFRNKDLGRERSMTTTVARGETTTLRVDLLE